MSKYLLSLLIIGLINLILFSSPALAQSSFQGLGDLPGGTIQSVGTDVSADGSVIVGNSSSVNGTEGFRWTEGTGMLGIGDLPGGNFFSQPSGVSEDGSVIVGKSRSLNGGEAFRWTSLEMVGLGDLPGGIFNSWAVGVSSDGMVIAGIGDNQDGEYEAFRWTNSNGMVGLGNIPGGDSSWVWAMSNDGNVIVGVDRIHPTPQTSANIAFRWTPAGGMQPLNPPSGYTASYATGISGDGTVIIGYLQGPGIIGAARWTEAIGWTLLDTLLIYSVPLNASLDGSVITGALLTGPFIWDQNSGIRNLRTVFEQDYGLDLTEWWSLVGVDGISDDGTVITGTGTHIQGGQPEAWRAVLPKFAMVNPQAGERWIAGEKDTIKWDGGISGQALNIEFSTDSGATYSLIAIGLPADSSNYIWSIPQNILSSKVKIKISDFTDSTTFVVSDIFKIKGYVLTKYLPSGDYKPYSMLSDTWGFANYPNDVWPATWWQQFNYQGTDPFTGSQYSQWQGNSVFESALSSEHPDWPAFVNTFGTSRCYSSTTLGLYSPTALSWWASVNSFWEGSCFGIAISNFLAYENKLSFQSRYPDFPNFVNASNVNSNINTIPVINELFTHQFGNAHLTYRANVGLYKTPNQTLNDLKQMFITDSVQLQTLSFLNNPLGTGGHAILAYKVEKDTVSPNIFYVYVYDNSYPDSLNARIVFNTTANGGNGSWSFNHWPTWGGNKWIYLRDPVSNYLSTPTINRGTFQQSPFIMGDNILRVNTGIDASVRIQDTNGNFTGYINGSVLLDIPNSTPLIVDNGSETPPYGYELPAENYSITLNNFTQETTKIFFFIGNKTFSYERSGAAQTQTDNLFFDGGLSVANHNAESKAVSLLNIINETSQEKLFVVRSVELAQNDSIKLENLDSLTMKLISYGSSKDYDIELNYVTETGVGRFGDFNISLDANTSHTFVPDWSNVTNTELMVLVDFGNNGTIDDTLSLINQVTGIGDEQGSLLSPNSYNLAQNYPNPFNPTTTIRFSIPSSEFVTLKVYDILGNEIATLVNEEKERGVYAVNFDGSNLASGMYLYRLQAGSFVQTRKMLLLK